MLFMIVVDMRLVCLLTLSFCCFPNRLFNPKVNGFRKFRNLVLGASVTKIPLRLFHSARIAKRNYQKVVHQHCANDSKKRVLVCCRTFQQQPLCSDFPCSPLANFALLRIRLITYTICTSEPKISRPLNSNYLFICIYYISTYIAVTNCHIKHCN